MTYKTFDVVTVPFPFTDLAQKKKRPALVLSAAAFNDPARHSLMAMITSAKNRPWPFDIKILDLKKAGLSAESVIRMKVFTLDHRFVLGKIGTLAEADRKAMKQSLSRVLGECL